MPFWYNRYRPRWRRTNYYQNRTRYRRRRWHRRRRPGAPIRRRHRRRHWVRRRRKKLKSLPLRQYQPKTIHNCKIKGIFPLLICSHGRESRNYSMYQTTAAPRNYPAGGGFSTIKFTLASLFTEHSKYRNWWTRSNEYLDLARYRGVKLKFYRHDYVDYVTVYSLCYPMTISRTTHMQCHPFRLLLSAKKIIVPSKLTLPQRKKPYVKKWIKPPSQWTNKWFFQQHIAETGLILLYTASCSLDHFFAPANQKNNTVGFYCINPNIFQKGNWATAGTGYFPNDTFKYYGTLNGTHGTPTTAELIPLTSIKNEVGKPNASGPNQATPGNLLYHDYIHGSRHVWQVPKAQEPSTSNIKPLDLPLIYDCRYNAYDDDGTGNEVYFLSTFNTSNYEPPRDTDLIFRGYPIWLVLHGLTDWIRKLRPASQIDLNYYLVIRTNRFQPKLTSYILINKSFIDGEGPWGTEVNDLSDSTLSHWYPRVLFQEEAINDIVKSGPAMPRAEQLTQWEAHVEYNFSFKWGGCPSYPQNIEDPASQPAFPVPDKELLRSQAEDPHIRTPTNTVYSWDYRRGNITEKALKRYTKDTSLSSIISTEKNERQRKALKKILQKELILSPQTPQEKKTSCILLKLLQRQQRLNKLKQLT
nr:MAG: ORF1 [TTV-like mini virus]UGV38983.1 MAG: ORF1 [TTV-like mini virus]